jgi:hypothetical protein
MSVEVVSKKKFGSICKECDHNLSDDEISKKECGECGSTDIKKSLVIVRKAVGDEGDDLEAEVSADDVDEVDEDAESDEEEEEDEEDSEDDEDEEDDEEEEEEVAEEGALVKSLRSAEVLNIMTACAEDVIKALDSKDTTAYEEAMVEVNNVLDSAMEKWSKGKNITKADDAAGHLSVIRDRVDGIIGKDKKVTVKKSKETVSTITKREDLPEDVQKSLKEADRIVEEATTKHWDEVAEGYSHFPGDKKELAKTLRALSEADEKSFTELKKTLDSAQTALESSEVLKSWGSTGGSENGADQVSAEAKEIAKAENITVEQAQVRLMDGKNYQPTNS